MFDLNEMILEFRGMIFTGLKLRVSNKYSDEYFENLLKEDTHYNRVKYREAVIEQIDDQIHVKLSWSIIAKGLSLFCIVLALYFGFHKILILGLITIGIGILFHFLFNHFRIRANEIYAGKLMSKDLVDVIFENQK